jgi:DmsE family decaheme c-type cytochrome
MRRFVISMACLLLLTGFAGTRSARAAGHGPQQAATSRNGAAAAPSGYVGQEMCATCHEDVVKNFAGNPHSRLAYEHNGHGVTCESCHGPGQAHVEGGGDVTRIRHFDKLTPQQINETCLGCHAGVHPNFERSPHAKGGLSCLSCHSIHAAKTDQDLLIASQPQLCFQCHTDIKPNFDMPFHHPVNEGVVKCTDCHDVHGTFGPNNLRSTADQNMICTKCHMDVRGPFVYEHPAVRAEGCLACHSPHGSENARMLNMPSINTLCNQCHSRVAAGTVHGMNSGSDEIAPCTSCHTYIHGSNIDAAFLR